MRNNSVLEFSTIKSKFSQTGTITEEVRGTQQALIFKLLHEKLMVKNNFFIEDQTKTTFASDKSTKLSFMHCWALESA